jgi:hypothetical protein
LTAIETIANGCISIYGLNKGQKNVSLTMVNITPKHAGEILVQEMYVMNKHCVLFGKIKGD